jgi:hypothetical protein
MLLQYCPELHLSLSEEKGLENQLFGMTQSWRQADTASFISEMAPSYGFYEGADAPRCPNGAQIYSSPCD